MAVATLSFLAFGAAQVGTPGPANMVLLATGARHGLRGAWPFVAGVVLGKQLIIWPIGFGLSGLAETAPVLFEAMKWASAAYIIWLAWRVAGMGLEPGQVGQVPGFWAGLIVHPLNPKAWAMILAGFTGFVEPGTPALLATATIAGVLLGCQIVSHPIWTLGGERIARSLAGTQGEAYLMRSLAALTVASVLFVLVGGGF